VKPEKITVDSPDVRIEGHSKSEERLLSTPPPWEQPWLDEHGLRVVYKSGSASLAFQE